LFLHRYGTGTVQVRYRYGTGTIINRRCNVIVLSIVKTFHLCLYRNIQSHGVFWDLEKLQVNSNQIKKNIERLYCVDT